MRMHVAKQPDRAPLHVPCRRLTDVLVHALCDQLYDAATKVPSACKVFVEMPDTKHDDPLTQAEKTALTTWVNQRRAAMT